MKKIRNILMGLSVLCTSAFAQKETVKPSFGIGSEVSEYPKVQWIQGEPVTRFDPDKIYIVECWATWCGPCKAAIPHVNQLQKKFGNKVVIIGQNIWETNPKKVADFVKQEGDGMSYRIAYGGGQESDFSLKFMKAAGLSGIPQTFVIQDNKVVWMPNPEQLSEEAIQLLIDRKFNLDAAKKMDPAKKYDGLRKLIFEEKAYDRAMVVLDSMLEKNPFEDTGVMMKWVLYGKMGKPADGISFLKQAYDQHPTSTIKYLYYKTLEDNKQWDVLAKETAVYLKENPGDDADASEAMIAWYSAIYGQGDLKGAAALLNRFTVNSKNPQTLMRIAFIDQIVPAAKPDAAIAAAMFKAGEKSLALDPVNLMLSGELVKRSWEKGDKEKAKKLTEKTISDLKKAGGQEKLVSILEQLLASLKKGILPSDQQFKLWKVESNK
ncbi:TlpA disulfide reductase family protein [Pedobacter sp.]|jgi:thiol-disulfide isomerase/thioredoxin|uniref:TlpA disulfide reductase family protein n=1 Tax=Pedobacter sp. TaxID=1411316 RepID=UPI002D0B8386|nr:TlpA disulfide reductase family protein [Pedobacter sp.]HWW40844.1 TlpA disulfide reductase family protein [Pedobacter sp.]